MRDKEGLRGWKREECERENKMAWKDELGLGWREGEKGAGISIKGQ